MTTYLIRRLLDSIVTLVVLGMVVFLIAHLAPGGPAALMLGMEASTEQVEAFNTSYGLDKPLSVQFLRWFSKLARGDLGTSIFLQKPVLLAVTERLEPTLLLTALALGFAVAFGIPLGVLAATKRNSAIDQLLSAFTLIGFSVPNFWLGILLMLAFSVSLRWFPTAGYVTIASSVVDNLHHLVLPAFSLSLPVSALILRTTRSVMLDSLGQDYMQTARAKGLREAVAVWKHAFKNSGVQVLTVVSIGYVMVIGGSVLIENIFALPGIGRLMIKSVLNRDYALLQGAVILIAASYMLVNLICDILYGFFDPRIRY